MWEVRERLVLGPVIGVFGGAGGSRSLAVVAVGRWIRSWRSGARRLAPTARSRRRASGTRSAAGWLYTWRRRALTGDLMGAKRTPVPSFAEEIGRAHV